MSENNPTLMEKAQARFAETQKKAAERNKATAEYVSEAKVRAVKTAKLRELRLAKEEVERAAESANPVKVRAQRAPRTTKGKTHFARIVTRVVKG